MKRNNFWFLLIIGIFLAFASCNSKPDTSSEKPLTNKSQSTDEPSEQTSSMAVPALEVTSHTQELLQVTSPLSSTVQPNEEVILGTPTPDLRLPPERWMEWPVVPSLSERGREIYQMGLAMGNNPGTFSKVGDCQSIKEVLLGIYDLPDRYVLPKDQLYLQETIDHFAGSFNRDGMAVKGGYNAAAVLSPMWADPQVCQPGEKPIECEYRVNKPSIVIISLEVWWQGRTVERYESYMRQIIEFYIDHGVLPILSTKADNVEGNHSINLETAKLAYEYDLPLWNFWLAVQNLPNQGIDPNRDGFHITTAAWNVRSFTALETLDAVWRTAQEKNQDIESISPLQTPTSENIASTISLPTKVNIVDSRFLDDNNVTGQVIFGIKAKENEGNKFLGIWSLDFNNRVLKQIDGEGFELRSVSPDGKQILINNGSNLYLIDMDGSNQVQITNNFSSMSEMGAAWLTKNQTLFYIGKTENERFIYKVGDNSVSIQMTKMGDNPIGLLQSAKTTKIYYVKGDCAAIDECIASNIWSLDPNSGINEEWLDLDKVQFSFDNAYYAYIKVGEDQGPFITKYDGSGERYIKLGGDALIDFKWANNQDKLAALMLVRSDYSGLASQIRIYMIDSSNWVIREFAPTNGLNPQIVWSWDDQLLLTTSTMQVSDDTYRLVFQLNDIQSKQIYEMSQLLGLSYPKFLNITNIIWIPDQE